MLSDSFRYESDAEVKLKWGQTQRTMRKRALLHYAADKISAIAILPAVKGESRRSSVLPARVCRISTNVVRIPKMW